MVSNPIDQKIQRAASGEHRLNPDEQRYYMNTYRERVLLTANIEVAESEAFKKQFDTILMEMANDVEPIYVKISTKMNQSFQIFYLKISQEYHIKATITDNEKTACPFGIIIHTDHAINREQIDVLDYYPDIITPSSQKKEEKASFLQKILKKFR